MHGTILLMEDDLGINKLLTNQLQNEGFKVIQTFDGEEAISQFNESIDLAILDIMVPKKDGFEVLSIIRESSHIPILFLTARDSDVDKVMALGLGADDYVTKPFSIVEVIYRVKAHVRRHLTYNTINNNINNSDKNSSIKYGDIEIDSKKFEVTLDGLQLHLSVKEFELLFFLISNPGQVFTKQQLYENIWNDNYYGDDNTIMVHISRLREKLNDDPKNPTYIKTIKGLGYRLEQL